MRRLRVEDPIEFVAAVTVRAAAFMDSTDLLGPSNNFDRKVGSFLFKHTFHSLPPFSYPSSLCFTHRKCTRQLLRTYKLMRERLREGSEFLVAVGVPCLLTPRTPPTSITFTLTKNTKINIGLH